MDEPDFHVEMDQIRFFTARLARKLTARGFLLVYGVTLAITAS